MKNRIKAAWKHPHTRAIIWTIIVFLVSGVASVALFCCCGAISAILASICAGCATGIVFYVITNIRNNEIRAINEEYEEAGKNYQIAGDIIHLCTDTIEGNEFSEERVKDICKRTNRLITYVSTLCFDAPKTTELIKDFSSEYVEQAKKASNTIEMLEKNETLDLTKDQVAAALMVIMDFCEATRSMLIKPWIKLMSEYAHLEKSVF